jgi:dipeptidase E
MSGPRNTPLNLVFFSGGDAAANRAMRRQVSSLLPAGEQLTIALIPAHAEDWDLELAALKKRLRLPKASYEAFPLRGKPLSTKAKRRLLSADAIYLGGGNTFTFLSALRKSALVRDLKKFAERGGLLMGLSAGGILMTPHIRTASVPSMDADDNYTRLTNFRAMKLVPFDFSPHYESCAKADAELLAYSRRLKRPILACPDGAGVVVKDGRISLVGAVSVFHEGRKMRALPRLDS